MRNLKEESRRTFNSQAETFDTGADGKHSRDAYPAILNVLDSMNHEMILDMGCGTGALLEQVLQMKGTPNLYGLDLSEKMLEQAHAKLNGRVTLVQGDSEHLPFESNCFDVVCCNDSFHHYPNPKAVISEVRRILVPGGFLIICDPYQQFGALWITNFILRFSGTGNVRIYSQKEFYALLSEGFASVIWNKVGKTTHMVRGIKI